MSADVIVIGAGPAGISSAIEAASHGLHVLLLDEQPALGGQIYRAITENEIPKEGDPDILGEDYWRGRSLVNELAGKDIEYISNATVWTVEQDPPAVGYLVGERSYLRSAPYIILATGAYERPVPIPGWTLPGVMSAGAAQILMKAEGAVLSGPVVLAGSGPLLMLVACQLLKSGTKIAGFLETTSWRNFLAALPHLPTSLGAPDMLLKGLAMRREIRKSGIPVFSSVKGLNCSGEEKFKGIDFQSRGRHHSINADTLLLHEGVVPHVQITRLLNLDHEWVSSQRYWKPVLNKWGETSCEQIIVAGDGGGISGARTAEAEGRIAALHVATKLNILATKERDRKASPYFSQKRRELRIRPLLDHLYRPSEEIVCPTHGATLVCRCEEVNVQEVLNCIETGCDGPNQLKAYSRCGMGPCQGRMCGLTVSELIARKRGVAIEEVGYYRIRTPIKPIPLSALAALEVDDEISGT